MRVWITKYALTQGIQEAEATVCTTVNKNMIKTDCGARSSLYHRPDWHETLQEANIRAEEMRTRKIASLRKQIIKLESLSFA